MSKNLKIQWAIAVVIFVLSGISALITMFNPDGIFLTAAALLLISGVYGCAIRLIAWWKYQ